MRDYHKAIVFTEVPLTGSFRFRDVFQIFPAKLENMPYSQLQRHYPIILEYWTVPKERVFLPSEFENLNEMLSSGATSLTKQDKILSLLSAFTNNLFFRYPSLSGFWGMPILKNDAGEEANNWASKWCWTLYHFPELSGQLKIDRFSDLQTDPIKRLPHYPFYTNDPNLDLDNKTEIVFPNSLEGILEAYFNQPDDVIQVIDTAISYAVSAIEMKDSKKTFSLLSAFSALETMVNLEFKGQDPKRCKECGQLQYSVTRKFRDFLLKYIGNNDHNKHKFNEYYKLRSKIVHTGEKLKSEDLFSDIPDDIRDSEFLTTLEIIQLGKLAIINWLLRN